MKIYNANCLNKTQKFKTLLMLFSNKIEANGIKFQIKQYSLMENVSLVKKKIETYQASTGFLFGGV